MLQLWSQSIFNCHIMHERVCGGVVLPGTVGKVGQEMLPEIGAVLGVKDCGEDRG